jgi:hypothetical protein
MEKEIIRHLVTVLKEFNGNNIGDEIFLKDRNFKDLKAIGFVELKEENFPKINEVKPKAKRTTKK